MNNLQTWLRQPSTISGIGTLAGTLVAGLLQVAFKETTLSAVAALAVKGFTSILITDNTVAK